MKNKNIWELILKVIVAAITAAHVFGLSPNYGRTFAKISVCD